MQEPNMDRLFISTNIFSCSSRHRGGGASHLLCCSHHLCLLRENKVALVTRTSSMWKSLDCDCLNYSCICCEPRLCSFRDAKRHQQYSLFWLCTESRRDTVAGDVGVDGGRRNSETSANVLCYVTCALDACGV